MSEEREHRNKTETQKGGSSRCSHAKAARHTLASENPSQTLDNTGSGRARLFPSGDSVQPSNMSARLCLVQGSEEASRQITLVEELMTRWDIA